MSTIYILFAIWTYGEGSSGWNQEFNSQGACVMALNEGVRNKIFDRGICVPKG